MATVVLVGTLDTKGREYEFLRERVRAAGCDVILVDAGVLDDPQVAPDITRQEVAAAAGEEHSALVAAADRGASVEAMGRGAGEILVRLHAQGRLQGALGMGGSGGSSLVSRAMRALPIGIPKLLVSTMASGDTRPYVGSSDITMMHSVVDIAGLNRLSEQILGNAAAAIAGMAVARARHQPGGKAKPLIGATMFGVTTPCVSVAREWLEERGYEVVVFHANGSGGRAMESLMMSGYITAALDVTTTELADDVVGGVLSAGPHRLETAGSMGLPQVVSLGALDMGNFGPMDTVPEKHRGRNLLRHNPAVTLMRTTPQECAQLGRLMAAKLNRATGPLAVFIPWRGMSSIATEGGAFYDPEADEAVIRELKAGLRDSVEVVEMDTDINDPAFARAMAQRLHELYQEWESQNQRTRLVSGKENGAEAGAGALAGLTP